MNIYDFDKTIYDGDSSIDFYKFCVKKNKILLLNSFKVLFYYFLYFFKIKNKSDVKEVFFSFLGKVNNIDEVVNIYFEKHKYKIKDFYLSKNHSKDIAGSITACRLHSTSRVCSVHMSFQARPIGHSNLPIW